jgi:hypothetical protein
VLDTSFWTVGFKVGLLGYAMRSFDIVVPRAVEAELRATDARYPQRRYPDTALFDQVEWSRRWRLTRASSRRIR